MFKYGTLNRKKSWTLSSGMAGVDLLTLSFVDLNDYKYVLFKVPQEYIARPDLISMDHYGTDMYVDVICKLNGISNPFELNEGMVLILPEATYLNAYNFSSDNIQLTAHANELRQAPKTVQSKKRKANEAVVNDTRFKIDKSRGVVIY